SWAGNENASMTENGQISGGSNYPTVDVSPIDFTRYAVWMDDLNSPDHWELMMRYKTRDATSWSSLQVLPTYSSCYEPEITFDGRGTAHLIYTRRAFGSAVVWYTTSATPQYASSWTAPVTVSGQSGIDFPEPTATSDNYGNVYVVWPNVVKGQSEIYLRAKIDGVWQGIENVSGTVANSDLPDVAVDRNSGVIAVVWQERINNVWQIQIKTKRGGAWSSAETVTNGAAHCQDPTVAFDADGQVHIAYTCAGDIFYSGAEGGGVVVAPPLNVAVESIAAEAPRRKDNTITWKANPENKDLKIKNYKIHRKKKEQPVSRYQTVATVGAEVYQYRDRDLPSTELYTYQLSTLAEEGESTGSEEVTDQIVLPPIYPPTSLAVESEVGSAARKKDSTLTWAKNPDNKPNEVARYKIFRKKAEPGAEYGLVGSVGPDVFSYRDRDLVNDQRYTYRMSTLSVNGNESDPSEGVTDKVVWPPIYPPLDLAVASVLGDGPFKKDNALTWARNPENKDREVTKYKIFRKEQSEGVEKYGLIASVGPDVFSFRDRGLVNDKRYTYAALAVSYFGNESLRSGTVTDRVVYAPTHPPLNVGLVTRLDDAQTAKINLVTWQNNPLNEGLPIKSVRVYRKVDSGADYELYKTVPASTRRFEDKDLATNKKYLYLLTSLPSWEIESPRTVPVFEEWVFPPINLGIKIQINDSLFFEEKINTIRWKKNPLNDARVVRNYALWRKPFGEPDSAFRVLAEIDPSVSEYVDRKLKLDEKYVYTLTTRDSVGNESRKSRALSEN
ncbi:MAG: hypothetical protein JW742_09105, partial [Candidatus Aminicenantes bacterium]|nr:hypothetical protein [Candidatus Aminicenantes bacterium]